MQRYDDNLATRINGNGLQALSGVAVTVTDDATGLPAVLYSDEGVTVLPQPIVTDDNGAYGFYAPNGEYTVHFASARIAPFTRKIIQADPSENPNATLAQLAAPSGAGLTGWLRSAIGAVATTLAKLLGWQQDVIVFEFMTDAQIADVKARTYTLDVSAAIQAADAHARLEGKAVRLPRGGYLAPTLTMYAGSMWRGASLFPADWRVPAMSVTNIRGSIVTDQTALNQGYAWGLHASGFSLEGANVAGSKGLFVKGAEGATFENIGVSKFARGVEIECGMMNRFKGLNASGCTEASYYINGNAVTTSQEFEQCVARESPWGMVIESTASGYSIGTRLNGFLVESTTVGGINKHKSCSLELNGLYAENAPDGRAITNGTLLRLDLDGTDISPYDSVTIINGGNLAGDNFGLQTDATAIDIGACKFVSINGAVLRRAKNGIRCAASTPNSSVHLNMPQFVSITNNLVNTDGKIFGVYPSAGLAAIPMSKARYGTISATSGSSLAGQTVLAATEARAIAGQAVTLRIDDTTSPNVEFLNSAGARMALLTNAGNLYLTGAIGANGAAATLPSVTGSRGGNAALTSLLSQLEAKGFITNATTA